MSSREKLEAQGLFIVERLLGKMIIQDKNGKTQTLFKVKWQGYRRKDASWELAAGLPKWAMDEYDAEITRYGLKRDQVPGFYEEVNSVGAYTSANSAAKQKEILTADRSVHAELVATPSSAAAGASSAGQAATNTGKAKSAPAASKSAASSSADSSAKSGRKASSTSSASSSSSKEQAAAAAAGAPGAGQAGTETGKAKTALAASKSAASSSADSSAKSGRKANSTSSASSSSSNDHTSDEFYAVNRLTGKMIGLDQHGKRKALYRVHWQEEASTWEPTGNLPADIINEYETQMASSAIPRNDSIGYFELVDSQTGEYTSGVSQDSQHAILQEQLAAAAAAAATAASASPSAKTKPPLNSSASASSSSQKGTGSNSGDNSNAEEQTAAQKRKAPEPTAKSSRSSKAPSKVLTVPGEQLNDEDDADDNSAETEEHDEESASSSEPAAKRQRTKPPTK